MAQKQLLQKSTLAKLADRINKAERASSLSCYGMTDLFW